LEKTKSVSKL